MKISFGSNFSFLKLLKYVNSQEYGDYMTKTLVQPMANSAKRNIMKGVGKPLTKLSRQLRRKGCRTFRIGDKFCGGGYFLFYFL